MSLASPVRLFHGDAQVRTVRSYDDRNWGRGNGLGSSDVGLG